MPKLKNSNATFWSIFKHCEFALNRLYFCIDFPFSLLFFCSWRRKERQTLLLLLLGEKLKSQVICVQSCCNGVKTQACLTFLMAVFYFVTYNIPCGYCSAAHMNPSPVVKTRRWGEQAKVDLQTWGFELISSGANEVWAKRELSLALQIETKISVGTWVICSEARDEPSEILAKRDSGQVRFKQSKILEKWDSSEARFRRSDIQAKQDFRKVIFKWSEI